MAVDKADRFEFESALAVGNGDVTENKTAAVSSAAQWRRLPKNDSAEEKQVRPEATLTGLRALGSISQCKKGSEGGDTGHRDRRSSGAREE